MRAGPVRAPFGWFYTPFGLVIALLSGACQPVGGGAGDVHFDPGQAVWSNFSGEAARRHCAALVGFGPRPSGSPALERARVYLETQLKAAGWTVERQTFTEPTPRRQVEFVNLRARFGTVDFKKPVRVIIGSHYDTKYFPDIRFTGANDGGSSSGALLEIARVVALRPVLAQRMELVFFDGEEAVEDYTATDGLYGSRHYAREITRRQKPGERPRAVVILDMIGDPDLHVRIPSDTPRDLAEGLFAAARDAGTASYFGWSATPITDDHAPFQREGVPAIDLIDLDFAPWHTSGDAMEQVSSQSLEAVGRSALLFVEQHLVPP